MWLFLLTNLCFPGATAHLPLLMCSSSSANCPPAKKNRGPEVDEVIGRSESSAPVADVSPTASGLGGSLEASAPPADSERAG